MFSCFSFHQQHAGSSNIFYYFIDIAQCKGIYVQYLSFARKSDIKITLETNAQTKICGGYVTRNNLNCKSQKVINQNATADFLQHTPGNENFVYFDVAN